MKLKVFILTLSFLCNVSNASDIEIVSRFAISIDGEIKSAPSDHVCLGRYKVDRSMHVPNQDKGFPDWNNTAATPSNGMSIKVYELNNGRSWLFSIKHYDKKTKYKGAIVGFGLFCIKDSISLTRE